MDIQYDGGLTFLPDNEEDFTWGDAFRMTNSAGMFLQNPELYGSPDETGYTFTQEKDWQKLSGNELDWVYDATSSEDYQNRLARAKLWQESADRFQNDSSNFNKYGKSFVAGAADPVGFVPYAGWAGKAMQVGKAANTLSRMGKTFGVVGTMGAATNVASDYILEQQGAPVDYASSALWGFALAGSLGSVVEGVSRTRYKAKMSDALLRDDIARAKEIDDALTPQINPENPDAPPIMPSEIQVEGMPTPEKIDRGSRFWGASDVHKLHSSELDSVRDFGGGADNPTVMTETARTTTARTYSKNLDGRVHEAQLDMAMQYRDAVKDGQFKGSMDEYFDTLGRDYHRLAAEQENRVFSDPVMKDINKAADKEIRDARKKAKQDYAQFEEGLAILKQSKTELGLDKDAIKAAQDALEARRVEIESEVAKLKVEVEIARNEKLMALWSKHKVEIPDRLKPMQKYFSGMLDEGRGVGVRELDNVSPDRLYIPRQIDFAAARNLDEVTLRTKIYNGLRKHPSNEKIADADLMEAASRLAVDWRTKGLDVTYNDPLFNGRSIIENKKTYGARRLKIDNNEIMDILNSHAADVIGGYHYFTRGQIALRKAYPQLRNTYSVSRTGKEDEFIGTKFEEKIVKPVYDEIAAKGLERGEYEEDILAMRNVFNDVMGNLRIFQGDDASRKFYDGARIAAQANAATLSGWFGLNQTLEIPSALWATGFNRLYHRQFGTIMKDVVKTLATDGKPNTVFMQELSRIGYLSSLFEQSGLNRMTDTTTVFNMGKIENKLHKLNSKLYKYNGMRAMTAFLEAMVASNAVTLIRSAGKGKVSTKQMAILKKFGLSPDDIRAINKELDRIGDITPDGTINKLGLNEMEATTREKLMGAMSNAIEEGVIQGDSMKLPNWMILPGPMKLLVTQFLRFPLIANEVLLRKGIRDDVAGMAASVVGTYMMSMGIRYLEEQARIGLGVTREEDAQYDLMTEEGLYNNVLKSTNYIAAFGGLTIPYQYMTAMLQTGLFGEYKSSNAITGIGGVTVSRVQTISDMLNMAINGKMDSEKFWKGAQSFTPLYNLPIYKDAVQMIIDENTIDY